MFEELEFMITIPTIRRVPFTPTRLEEARAKDKGAVVTLRLNERELADLEKDKVLCDIGPDSSMIKLLVHLGRKVLHDQITARHMKYLVSRKRTRYTPRSKL